MTQGAANSFFMLNNERATRERLFDAGLERTNAVAGEVEAEREVARSRARLECFIACCV